MGVQLYKNNAGAVLNGTIAIGGTTLNLASGQGSRFPTPTGGDDFLITIFEKDAGGTEINYEIARCTARTADALTIVRDVEGIVVAAGGTSGGWAYPAAVGINPSGVVYVQMRETAGTFEELLSKRGNLAGLASAATARSNIGAEASANKATDFSTVNHTLFPTVQAVKSYADALVVGLWDDRGSYNASGNTWPSSGGSGTAGAILKGDIWTISTGGTLGGSVVAAGDTIRALQDTPGTTAANWAIAENNIGYVPENATNKDAPSGYVGLDASFRHILKNAAGTVASLFASVATVARTWTFPDKSGTVAMTSDCDATGLGATVSGATAKATPVDADTLGLSDSAASGVLKSLTWSNVKATLKAYFDSLYAPVGSVAVGFRNRVINGDIRVDQRNAGSAQTFTAGAALAYAVDQWYGYCSGANVTGQRIGGSGQAQYRYQFTGAASVTGIGFGQRIEAANCYDLNGQTCTLSVDLANSLLTTVTWTAYYANTADAFGTLASPTRTQIATGNFTVSSTVSRYSAQISVPSAATTGIEVVFSVGAQTSGTWTVGNVQLEQSSTATTFERRPIEVELTRCQRYYQRVTLGNGFIAPFSGLVQSATSAYFQVPFKVQMRAAPTFNVSSVSGFLVNTGAGSTSTSNLTLSNGTQDGCFLVATTSGQTVGYAASMSATGATQWIDFSSVL